MDVEVQQLVLAEVTTKGGTEPLTEDTRIAAVMTNPPDSASHDEIPPTLRLSGARGHQRPAAGGGPAVITLGPCGV